MKNNKLIVIILLCIIQVILMVYIINNMEGKSIFEISMGFLTVLVNTFIIFVLSKEVKDEK